MSGLAGIFNLTGEPVNPELLSQMTAAIPYRGPDGMRHVIDGQIAIGHCMLCTTPESLHETQPLWDEGQRYCLAMDGRVDNRAELMADLKTAGMVLRDDTDAELVLKAFLAWGNDSPRRIIGDYAYVIWNRRDRTLFCARDHIGIKPFYYYTNGLVFVWASEIQQLFKLPFVPKEPNESMIAEYLADRITSLEETLYVGLMRLTPAHFMLVKPSGVEKKRYWDLDPKKKIRYKTEGEYADHLRAILTEAVKCRMRTNYAVGAELSGGLDSSTVVGLAASLAQKGEVKVDRFETFSLTFPDLPCDETKYFTEVVNMWAVKHTAVLAESDPVALANDIRKHQHYPDTPNGYMFFGVNRIYENTNLRILLTGLGGDQWLDVGCLPDFVTRIRTNLSRVKLLKRSYYLIRQLCRLPISGWIDPNFARRTNLSDRVLPKLPLEGLKHHQAKIRMTLSGYCTYSLELSERSQSNFGVEQRHPFYDRRLVEFAYAIPGICLYRKKASKPLLRLAMADLLPSSILNRTCKAEFSCIFAPYFFTLQEKVGRLRLEELGWVNSEQISAKLNSCLEYWESGLRTALPNLWPIWAVLATEMWYVNNFEKRFL